MVASLSSKRTWSNGSSPVSWRISAAPRACYAWTRGRSPADAKLDGNYLLRTGDPHLSTEDIALGYKQLLEVERGWRDLKQILDLRPVCHRIEDRIRDPCCRAGSPCSWSESSRIR